MSITSSVPFTTDINNIRENYDTSNSVVAEIIKAKEERMRILNELNQQQKDEELSELSEQLAFLKNKKRASAAKRRKSETNSSQVAIRRSARIQNSPSVVYREDDLVLKEQPVKSQIIRPPNDYGPMPGIEVGHHWEKRIDCSLDGVHRPTVAGIHGGPDGAYSIALSGGYPEDVDEGYSFLYTGAGGRDLKGTSKNPKNLRIAPQTKDQQLEGTNLSLVKSIESKLPIRVIRGYNSPSIFAPETGYRYDGLYQVMEYWEDVGKTGHRIYRYRMERIKDQAPPPWESNHKKSSTRREKINSDFVDNCNDDFECKENIEPSIGDFNYQINMDVSYKEVKDVDNEIERCINHFVKTNEVENAKQLENGSSDVDFLGWDSV